MMLINHVGTKDSRGYFRVMGLKPRRELLHFVRRTLAVAKNQNAAGVFQGFRYEPKETVGIRFFLTAGEVLGVVRGSKKISGLVRQNFLRGARHFRAKNTGVMVIDYHQALNFIFVGNRDYMG